MLRIHPASDAIPDLRGKEMTFETVRDFVRSRRHASCFEIQKAFGVSYADAVHAMDALEDRQIVGPAEPIPGPRPILQSSAK